MTENFVTEANAAFPQLGDQLCHIQKSLDIWRQDPSDANVLQVQAYLNGFIEVIIVNGTGREMIGSGMMVTEVPTEPVAKLLKAKKPKTLEVKSQTAFQFIKQQKVHHNEQICNLCSSLLHFASKTLTDLKFPIKAQTHNYAWEATLSCIHHESPGDALKFLSGAHPAVFGSVFVKDFTLFYKEIKDKCALNKKSFHAPLVHLAKKKIEGETVPQTNINDDNGDSESASEDDLDNEDLSQSMDKYSNSDNTELGVLGASMLQEIRGRPASKAPRKQVCLPSTYILFMSMSVTVTHVHP